MTRAWCVDGCSSWQKPLTKDTKLAKHEKVSLLARALKLKGQHVFKLNEQRAFTMCDGYNCHACCVKKKRANVHTICKSCDDRKKNINRQSSIKVANKIMKVAPDSKVDFRYLDKGD